MSDVTFSLTVVLFYSYFISLFILPASEGSDDARRLYYDLLTGRKYNKLIRPVGNSSQKLNVKMGIRLSQLIDIDEKNQIMTTNVWLRQEWTDIKLTWKPEEYGGVTRLYVPSEKIWLPDIVLYNNADGNFVVTLMTKATIHYDGLIIWEPPVIYKSACIIDVEYFPFDMQCCRMKFGSWTYDGNEIDLVHMCAENDSYSDVIQNGINFADLYPNVEWDVLQGTAVKHLKKYPCCPEPYIDVTFEITIRRKTLFHTVNLILPCVAISFLTVIVFYLPSDSGEKITLCISILLSLTVFFLLLAEIIPPTSIVIPLIGKYLLLTMISVTLSIVATIVTIRIHFRSPTTHKMSSWVKCIFLKVLPKLMFMTRPKKEPRMTTHHSTANYYSYNTGTENGISNETLLEEDRTPEGSGESGIDVDVSTFQEQLKSKHVDMKKLDAIVEHLKRQDHYLSIREDWKFVAMVIDRLFLLIFTTACMIGLFGVIAQAPTLYDSRLSVTEQGQQFNSCIQY